MLGDTNVMLERIICPTLDGSERHGELALQAIISRAKQLDTMRLEDFYVNGVLKSTRKNKNETINVRTG